MAALTTAIIVGASIAAAGAVTAGVVASQGAKKAAETQARSQQQALGVQKQAAIKEQEVRQEAVGVKTVAAEERKAALGGITMPTILETPTGPQLKTELEERLAGRRLTPGVTPLDISKTTAPFAAQRRAGVEREKATIGAAASAAGLGRATIPVSQMGEAARVGERDIESRVAELQVTNKNIERANLNLQSLEIQDALARFESLTGREATDEQKRALFEAQKLTVEEAGQIGIADTIAGNATIEKANQFAISESIATMGATEASWQLKQAAILGSGILEAGAGFGQAISKSNDDIISAINESKQDRGLGAEVLRGQKAGEFETRRLDIMGG